MTEETELAEAVRRALGLADGPGRGVRVVRLEKDQPDYWLVILPEGEQTVVAAFDAASHEVLQWASTASPPALLTAEQAKAAAGLGGTATARLVWQPSTASYSPLYPLWEVSVSGTRVWVNQQGAVSDSLAAHRG